MKLTALSQNLTSVALKAAPLATVFACFTLANGNLQAQCNTINSSGGPVGSICSGISTPACSPPYVGLSGQNSKNCHICVLPAYAAQIANNNFTGLTITPTVAGAPTDFQCLHCTPPPGGLTAWWTLDEGSALSVPNFPLYTNPSIQPGTRYGATAVAGHDAALGAYVTNANHFNGSNEYLEIPNTPALDVEAATQNSGDFSIDAWVKLDPGTDSSGVRVIVEKRTFTPPSLYKGYSLYLYNQYLGLQVADGGAAPGYTNYGASALVVPEDGLWHFVAVSVAREASEPFQVQFTLDSESVTLTSPARYGSLANTSNLRIGMLTIGTGSVFNGSIDEVEFFSVAVPEAEFQSIYTASCYGKCKY